MKNISWKNVKIFLLYSFVNFPHVLFHKLSARMYSFIKFLNVFGRKITSYASCAWFPTFVTFFYDFCPRRLSSNFYQPL